MSHIVFTDLGSKRWLILFFQIFPFDPPENIRKLFCENSYRPLTIFAEKLSYVFRGIEKEHWEVRS